MRKALISILLMGLLTAQAVALPIIPILIGIGLAGSGIIGYYLGVTSINHSYVEELEQKYQQAITQNKEDNDKNIWLLLSETYARDSTIYKTGTDFGEYTKNYAWALAKWSALKALSEGYSAEVAKQRAKTAVMDYYDNITKTLINNNNATVNLLNTTLNSYKDIAGLSEIYLDFPDINTYATEYLRAFKYDPSQNKWVSDGNLGSGGYANIDKITVETTSKTVAGKGYNIAVLKIYYSGTGYYAGNPYSISGSVVVTNIKMRGADVYVKSDFDNVLNQINNAYNSIINEIDAYVDSLALAYPNGINLSQFIDPYILASQLHSDLQNYNYSGYLAGEIALLGLNTHGLNKTVTILINNTTMTGWLFTDYVGNISINQSIDPTGHKWFIVTETGIYQINDKFTITDLRTLSG